MKKRKFLIIGIIVIVVIGIASIALKRTRGRITLVGMRIPSSYLWTEAGKEFTFNTQREKVILLVIGDNGCFACRQFISRIEKTLIPKFKQDVLFIYLDTNEKTGIPSYPEFISLKSNKGFQKKLWVKTIPATYIIDKKGIIRVWEIGNEPGLVEEELLDTLTALTKKGGV